MKREETIDLLRALAIFVMIFLHVAARFYSDKTVFFLWDIAHFAVPIFVFCSGYIFFERELKKENFSSLVFFKKRFLKLLVPYYIFLLIYFVIVFFTQPQFLTRSFIIGSLTLTGGIDINWLVLLFIQLTLVLILMRYLILKRFWLFILFSLLSLLSAFYLLFPNYSLLTTNYKLFMWLPWSLVFVFNYFFSVNKEKRQFVLKMIILSAILFLISLNLKLFFHKPFNFYSSKYPPNSYYLFYGLMLMNIFYLLFKKFTTSLTVKNFFYFVSANSYSIFFIHYLLIYILVYFSLNKIVGLPVFFLLIITISLIVQSVINNLYKRLNFK